jgi:hypothetical protein
VGWKVWLLFSQPVPQVADEAAHLFDEAIGLLHFPIGFFEESKQGFGCECLGNGCKLKCHRAKRQAVDRRGLFDGPGRCVCGSRSGHDKRAPPRDAAAVPPA